MKKAINKRLVLNGFLLLLVLSLIGFITQQSNKKVMIASLYDNAMGNEIHSIVIHYPKIENKQSIIAEIQLEKKNGLWMMIKPINTAIDERKIKHLTTLLFDPISASYPIKDKDLSRFGLGAEQVSIRFNGVKIQLGSLNPISHQRYVRQGEHIHLVAETIYGLLIGGTDSFMPISTD
jgi:hypothetical protein